MVLQKEIRYSQGDEIEKVSEGTTKLIIDTSVKNIIQSDVSDESRNGRKISSFPGYETIEHIIIEEGVTHIGSHSFAGCTSLKSVTFPTSLKQIGVGAFGRCEKLCRLDLSETSILEICIGAFSNCKNLEAVFFPKSLTSIKSWAFSDCENLKSLGFPWTNEAALLSIGKEAFSRTAISTLNIPAYVTTIGQEAFRDCSELSALIISEQTKVHSNAFMNCTLLPSFMLLDVSWEKTDSEHNIDSSRSSVGDSTISMIELEDLRIVDNVGKNQYKGNDIIRYVEFEERVKVIDDRGFEGCTALEKIAFSSSLNKIGWKAFKGCLALKEIVIPKRVTEIQGELFADCTSLKKVLLSPYTTKIVWKAFENCKNLKDIEIPETVKDIGSSAFKNCESLKSIAIPRNTLKFTSSIFEGCSSLETVNFNENTNIKTIHERSFYQCSALKEIKLPSSITTIYKEAFYACTSITSISLHEGVTYIYDGAFAGCASLEKICIPSTTIKIGIGAFAGCTSLRKIILMNPNTVLAREAFAGCESLEVIRGLPSHSSTVSIEKRIQRMLDQKVFVGCRALRTPLGNEIHLAAENKCWPSNKYPEGSHLWLKHKLDKLNKTRESKDDITFVKDYNGDTAFQCAVRGGAPNSYLELLSKGFDEKGKTHLDHFAEKYARKNAEDFTDEELTKLKDEISKLILSTKIGEGANYLRSFEELLSSPVFDPRTVPEFIEELNKRFETRAFSFIILLEIIFPILRIVAFSQISDVYFNEAGEKENANIIWFVLIYISIIYLIIRELLQIQQNFLLYLSDRWNYNDVTIIILTSTSSIMMHATTYDPDENHGVKRFVILTTFFIWIYAVLKLRVVSEKFSVFVSGVLNIMKELLPFFFVAFFVLGTFAQMYFINDRSSDYSTFRNAFLQTLSQFLSFDGLPFTSTVGVLFNQGDKDIFVLMEKVNSTNWNELIITCVFGVLVVVILLNVVIAVANTAWEGASENGRDDFLLYRIRLFLEMKEVFDLKNPFRLTKNQLLISPDENYNEMWKDSSKFVEVLLRINTEGFTLVGRIILHMLYLILGLFTGLTLPKPVRKLLYTIDNSQAISDKRIHLQNLLNQVEEELERFEKIEKHIQMRKEDEYLHLVECRGISSRFELRRRMHALETIIQKYRKDVDNFKMWEEKQTISL